MPALTRRDRAPTATAAPATKGTTMATDLTITLPNEPGQLARLGAATGGAGVNLSGICGVTTGGQGTIHVLVEDDPAAARSALENAGITVDAEREVLLAEVQDRPGAVGEVARRLGDAGVNIELAYLATNTRLVLGVDDEEAARKAL